MCPNRQIDEPERLATVVELVHNANRENNEPIDLYRLHAYFTPTDEMEDDVADANANVGFDFGYGRPDLGEYEFEDEETRAYFEEFLEWFWPGPELLWVRDYESPAGSEVGSGDDKDGDEDEDESGRGEDEQEVGGDGDGDRVRTNTDPTTTAAAGEKQGLSSNSEHTNPDTPAAPASSNTNMQQATRLVANNDASAGEVQAQND